MSKKKKKSKKIKKKPPLVTWKWPALEEEIKGVFVLAFAVALFLSLFSFSSEEILSNWFGIMGHLTGLSFFSTFGISSFFLPPFLAWIGWRMLFSKPRNDVSWKAFYVFLAMVSFSFLLSIVEDRFVVLSDPLREFFYETTWPKSPRYHLGGAFVYYLWHDLPRFNFETILSASGTAIFACSLLLASIFKLAKITLKTILEKILIVFNKLREIYLLLAEEPVFLEEPVEKPLKKGFTGLSKEENKKDEPLDHKLTFPNLFKTFQKEEKKPFIKDTIQDPIKSFKETFLPKPETEKKSVENKFENKAEKKPPQKISSVQVPRADYKLPPLQLLSLAPKVDHSLVKQDLKRQAEILEETLLSFGIEAKVGAIHSGPTITSFEVHPAIGVKVQKIKTLENDIALNMQAKSIRIIAPIPGKAAVGIEIPNPHPEQVSFRDLLYAYEKTGRRFRIPVLLGKAVSGEWVMSDLAKMPHCIIAGATGSGKSVCINTIVVSILMNARPDEIKLLMVDPKKVELTPYSRLPHMLAPVITEPHGACKALHWLVKEMERRYEILKLTGVRNLESFNARRISEEEATFAIEIPEKMPYIVGIIDELADLMMASTSDIETPIARIAQMARAVGIHLILATQRPSREVITGLIKANFPTRIAFKVASRINSQIILDDIGAESLLGNGDMLFLPPGSHQLLRAQGAFVKDEDIQAIVSHISMQAPPKYLIESFDDYSSFQDPFSENGQDLPKDNLYQAACDVVIATRNASTTFLQRKLKIGYARAASLMDELEERGIIGPQDGSKSRKVLVKNSLVGQEEPSEEAFED